MKILIIGGGGREHTLAWTLAQDPIKPVLFCAPGNGGTATLGTNLTIEAEDLDAITAWATANRPDLTIIGPEAPLCGGLTDRLQAVGLRVFGPSGAAAQLEGSKIFAKDVMRTAGVPTAEANVFDDPQAALADIRRRGAPIVVKAEGLAAGKGVFVCTTIAEAEQAIHETMIARAFGEAGQRVVIEEFLDGEEASILALVDGEHVVMLASAQDHKRAFNNDAGPNTGGMGTYSPAPCVTDALWPVIRTEVFERTLAELRRRGITYRGVLYAGLMLTARGPKVLEFNCRFGDPETQVVLPRLRTPLLAALEACVDGRLTEQHVDWSPAPCVCVVMASGGYPGSYKKGIPITGIAAAERVPNVTVFHAGTRVAGDRLVTSGGRVLGVTALGSSLPEALDRVYRGTACIQFEGAHFRTDIAARALVRTATPTATK
ncbi:MAG: phosphoribosylamine--glycine ligase [Verrucomicrobia bacterium]|nr:phosphoribosylamine--glycine ligase [Verrucomicrobiota bacterium]